MSSLSHSFLISSHLISCHINRHSRGHSESGAGGAGQSGGCLSGGRKGRRHGAQVRKNNNIMLCYFTTKVTVAMQHAGVDLHLQSCHHRARCHSVGKWRRPIFSCAQQHKQTLKANSLSAVFAAPPVLCLCTCLAFLLPPPKNKHYQQAQPRAYNGHRTRRHSTCKWRGPSSFLCAACCMWRGSGHSAACVGSGGRV